MSGPSPKRLYIKSYGCQMNVYDSGRMADLLRPLGYAETDTPEGADVVVLNTCHIRENATEKVYSELGRLKRIKAGAAERGEVVTIAVAGCVAQAEGAEITRRQSAVDLVIGPQSYHRLPELIARSHRERGEALACDFTPEAKFDNLPDARGVTGPSAFLTVQEGCDKFCSFCVVPYTRGAEWSRPAGSVLAEAERLADQGVREVTLLGQNVNAYDGAGPDGGVWSLARLVRALARVDGIERIRFTTSHPNDMGDDLIEAFGTTPQLMPYLHLPVQSGSDAILKAMNRRHTTEAYLRTIERVRAARPDIAVSGDFIVGFPGETDTDFEATLTLVKAVEHAAAFSFKYSRRLGTPAAALPRQVAEPVKDERLARLQAVLNTQQAAFNAGCVGRTLPVLWERPGRNPGQIVGRSPYLQGVHATGPIGLIGRITPAEIGGATRQSLSGALLRQAA